MKITILNGSENPGSFDAYLSSLTTHLVATGQRVRQLNLRDLDLRYCIGCFGCWVKTPGECSIRDDSTEIRGAMIQSDFTLWAAPLRMGYPSALLKMALDKSIPLIHPYFVVDRGEAHHRPRYDRYPRLGLLVEPESDTDEPDLEILANIFSRTALNMKSQLEFLFTTAVDPGKLVDRIIHQSREFVPFESGLSATQGKCIDLPGQLTLFNGSPRGSKGNTAIMLEQVGAGFAGVPERSFTIHNLNCLKSLEVMTQAFAEAECVLLGVPLYTDAMPGMVKTFIESLAPLKDRDQNPPIGFLVQSGFPEALHSRYLERYLQKLARRLKAPYLGTIVKGSGEGVRIMPQERNASLFRALQGLGLSLAESGALDDELLKQIAGIERYPSILSPFFKIFTRLPIASWYWDSQLKENGVYDQRFARPYQT